MSSAGAAPYSVETAPAGWAERALEVLLELAESMTSEEGISNGLNRLALLALRATGADRSAILATDPSEPHRLLPTAGASQAGDLASLWQRFNEMPPIELSAQMKVSLGEGGTTRAIEDVSTSPIIPAYWKTNWDSKSVAYAPIRAGGEIFGVVAVEYVQQHHRFTVNELKLLDAIATAAGVALRSARLVDRSQRAALVERRLRECMAALRSGASLAEILDVVADRFVSLIPEVSCAIALMSDDQSLLTPLVFRGIPPRGEIRISELPEDEVAGFVRWWAENPRRPVLIPDVKAHPRWEPFIPPEIGTGMLLPLPEGREVRGLVAVGRPSRPFTSEEVRVASAFADHAALAIEQARLTEALHLRVSLLQALYLLNDTVSRTSDLKTVLWALNREVGAELGVELTRLAFGDASLAEMLRTPVADTRERAILRRWRQGDHDAEAQGEAAAVPVSIQHRPVGILWARGTHLDHARLELLRTIAAGIGEVAGKTKLRRKAETNAQQLAVATDRERIARDLHDTVGQTLYGIGLKLQDVLSEIDDPELMHRLGAVRSLAAQGVADVRSAVYALSFLHVRDRGFVPSLKALARQFKIATGVNVQLKIVGTTPRLRDEIENALYRIAHEALVNVERHARATGIVIRFGAINGVVEMTIRDDGVGLGQRDGKDWRSAAHFGMRTMAKSIEEIGGRFKVEAAHPRGLVINAVVPLASERAIAR